MSYAEKFAALNKTIAEMQGAVRKLASENSNNLALIAKLREEVDALRQDLARVKRTAEQATKMYDNSIERY